ncbi:hypothetical protein E2C01_085078 [Portunus trituberculatus]|uniref:Uncharacterized protein n=1 Tax=Portunus trituberculatus TaxID=210409 RepID=A0A5B7J5U1_PORTR|nr:hypothetical protein [Portunus trituberculatus]
MVRGFRCLVSSARRNYITVLGVTDVTSAGNRPPKPHLRHERLGWISCLCTYRRPLDPVDTRQWPRRLSARLTRRRRLSGGLHAAERVHSTPSVSVIHIRLNCVPKLQQMIDTGNKWENLTPNQALDAVGELVKHSTNQAVRWNNFFNSRQGELEPMKDYFQRCSAEAAEYDFLYPMCEGDLSNFMLLRKLVLGLSDPVLKKVFQGCAAFTSGGK